jgi:hypothetical protein
MAARRILIKGCSGSGKSVLGRELAQLLGVPWVELDRLHHGPGWQAATAEELQHGVRTLLDDADGWVVDGNYDSKLGTLVLDRAELVIWLDLPLATKLKRLSLRSASNWLNDRELWNGNRESLKGWFGVAGARPPEAAGRTGPASECAAGVALRGRQLARSVPRAGVNRPSCWARTGDGRGSPDGLRRGRACVGTNLARA